MLAQQGDGSVVLMSSSREKWKTEHKNWLCSGRSAAASNDDKAIQADALIRTDRKITITIPCEIFHGITSS